MKYFLVFLIVCVTFVYNCDAQCTFALPVDDQIGCVFRGVPMDFGTTKDIECYRCVCGNAGMIQCCSLGGTIVNYPRECKVVKDGCSEKAVLISNPSVVCKQGVVLIGRK